MIWPTSTASILSLPKVRGSEWGSDSPSFNGESHDELDNQRITAIEISKSGYFIAVTTERGLYIYRPKPLCPVAVFIRSKSSLDTHGNNCTLSIRPDGHLIAVGTTLGSILTFQIIPQSSPNEVCIFDESFSSANAGGSKQPLAYPGPGEAIGVREVKLRFKMLVKVDSGIAHILSLDDYLLVATRTPPAIQFVRWTTESQQPAEERTVTVLLSHLKWLDSADRVITHITRSRAMILFSITTSSGVVYSATLDDKPGSGPQLHGHRIHTPSATLKIHDKATISSINARFSVVAVGCEEGTIYLYNILDYAGSVRLIRIVESPYSSAGNIQTMRWSSDGNALFVGYERGMVFYSVYGMVNASSFIASKEHSSKEPWLRGIANAVWSLSGDCIFMIPNDASNIWILDVLKWNSSGNFTPENLNRPVLYNNHSILLYRGHEQSDLTTIDKDALLWLSISIPASYRAENWPIRYVSCSPDGRYVALAGVRGLTHYSLHSGRWKLFPEEYMDREFTVRGGIVWYENFIIMAVDTEYAIHEIRVYNRDLGLNPQNLVLSMEVSSAVLKVCIVKDLLLIYTHSNNLMYYRISGDDRSFQLDLEADISFSGMVHSPTRVRALSCVPTFCDGRRLIHAKNTAILMLIDGMLALLQPSINGQQEPEAAFTKNVLHENVEFYIYCPLTNSTEPTLWAFDGRQLLAWTESIIDVTNNGKLSPPTSIPVESYPLALLVDKGIAIGIESDTVSPADTSFTYFKHWSTTELYVPWIIEAHLRKGQTDRALSLAREYRHLNYFGHILERLLSRVLEYEEETQDKEQTELLKNTSHLVCQFSQMLDVVLGATRKTEVKYWNRLFDIIGSPQELFEKCIKRGQLKTAAGYLLVLHNLENFKYSSQDTVRLLDLAYADGDIELCKELVRFLTAIDPSGKTLRSTLKSVSVDI